MSDKFKVNFWIVLPGAILTIIILFFLTNGVHIDHSKQYDYNLVKVIPYILVLVLAVIGVNVIVVLISGTILSGIIGLIDGSFNWKGLLTAISKGIIGMEDIAIIALLIGGLVGLIQHNGGVEWLLNFVKSKVKSKRGAEFGIASLVSVADIATTNNTISIIMSGPLAKNIADEYEVDPRNQQVFLIFLLDVFKVCYPIALNLLQQRVLLEYLLLVCCHIVFIQFY